MKHLRKFNENSFFDKIKTFVEKDEDYKELVKPNSIIEDPSTGFKYKIGDKCNSDVPKGTKMFCVSEYFDNKNAFREDKNSRWVSLLANSHPEATCKYCRNIIATDDPSLNLPKL